MEPLMALFPPGKGGGKEVAYGRKGKGVLMHIFTEGNGMPLAHTVTPANGDERVQVEKLLNQVRVRTAKTGRFRSCPKILAADKGYDSKELRQKVRNRGIRAQIPKRKWKTKATRGRPIVKVVPRYQMERCFALIRLQYFGQITFV